MSAASVTDDLTKLHKIASAVIGAEELTRRLLAAMQLEAAADPVDGETVHG